MKILLILFFAPLALGFVYLIIGGVITAIIEATKESK